MCQLQFNTKKLKVIQLRYKALGITYELLMRNYQVAP